MASITKLSESENELLLTFLKIYDLKEYKVIQPPPQRVSDPRIIIFDKKNNYYYKVFSNITKEIKKYDHVFLNNAHFPNHLVTSVIKDNIWIVKQSVPKGVLLSDSLRNKNTVYDKIIDNMLDNLLWAKNEAQRIFSDPIKNKLWDFSAGDSSAGNIIYDIQMNTATNIDIESSTWRTKEEYLKHTFNRFLKHFNNWNGYSHCNFLPILKVPKLLDRCLTFVNKEIL